MLKKPVIGITMGDAAGVGPEIIVKALKHSNIYDICSPVVIGDPKFLKKAIEVTKSDISLNLRLGKGQSFNLSAAILKDLACVLNSSNMSFNLLTVSGIILGLFLHIKGNIMMQQ